MSTTKSKNIAWYIHTVIVLFLMFGFGYIVPPIGSITQMGMHVLGVFLGLLWGWIAIEILWPSVLGCIAFGMTGYMTVPEVFSAGFGNATVLNVLLACLFAEILNQCRITDYIADKCLGSKWIEKSPWNLVVMFFVADFILSIFTSNVAAFFLLTAALEKVAKEAGYEKGNRFIVYMICSVLFIGVLGAMILPFQVACILFTGFFTSTTGLVIGYVPYTIYMLIISLVQMIVLFLAGKFVFRFDLSALKACSDTFKDKRGRKMNFEQKWGFTFIVLFVILLFIPAFLPDEWYITQLMNNWGLSGVAAFLMVLSAIVKKNDGKQLVNIREVCTHGIPWDIIWLLVATFPLATAMESEECGIMATVVSAISGTLGAMNPWILIILSMVVLGIITQFVHNVVLAAMFIPMLSTLCVSIGGDAYAMFFCVYFALQAAYATPGASMQGAMMFGHPWVERKEGFFFGCLFLVITYITLIIPGIPLAGVMF